MKITVLEPLGIPKEKLEKIAYEYIDKSVVIEFHDTRSEDVQTLIQRSKDSQILVLSNLKFDRKVMMNCPKLKMICVAFTGTDHIDMEYCRENNIVVCNCSGYATTAVAELTIGLVIGLYRKIVSCDKAVRSGKTKDGLVGFELSGKKFGIVGTGAIGQAVGKLASAFGCEVYTNNGKREVRAEGMTNVTFDELMRKCDIISLHTPLNESTRGFIDKEKLSLMKKSAVLINTSRGAVVDTNALADMLVSGNIAGAGIDVFDDEPPISASNPLLAASNVLLTPHVAFATEESMIKRAHIAFKNVSGYMNNQPQNIVK